MSQVGCVGSGNKSLKQKKKGPGSSGARNAKAKARSLGEGGGRERHGLALRGRAPQKRTFYIRAEWENIGPCSPVYRVYFLV